MQGLESAPKGRSRAIATAQMPVAGSGRSRAIPAHLKPAVLYAPKRMRSKSSKRSLFYFARLYLPTKNRFTFIDSLFENRNRNFFALFQNFFEIVFVESSAQQQREILRRRPILSSADLDIYAPDALPSRFERKTQSCERALLLFFFFLLFLSFIFLSLFLLSSFFLPYGLPTRDIYQTKKL